MASGYEVVVRVRVKIKRSIKGFSIRIIIYQIQKFKIHFNLPLPVNCLPCSYYSYERSYRWGNFLAAPARATRDDEAAEAEDTALVEDTLETLPTLPFPATLAACGVVVVVSF